MTAEMRREVPCHQGSLATEHVLQQCLPSSAPYFLPVFGGGGDRPCCLSKPGKPPCQNAELPGQYEKPKHAGTKRT